VVGGQLEPVCDPFGRTAVLRKGRPQCRSYTMFAARAESGPGPRPAGYGCYQAFRSWDYFHGAGRGLRIAPHDTCCGTDRDGRGRFFPAPCVHAEVALRCLVRVLVELHHVLRTGLHATGAAHHGPLPPPNGQLFREPSLDLPEALHARSRAQTRHLTTRWGVVSLYLGRMKCFSTSSGARQPKHGSWPLR
jgi:hypothetical protein